MTYEYKIASTNFVSEDLERGWEPVPDVPHIYETNAGYNSTIVYVFLRRTKS